MRAEMLTIEIGERIFQRLARIDNPGKPGHGRKTHDRLENIDDGSGFILPYASHMPHRPRTHVGLLEAEHLPGPIAEDDNWGMRGHNNLNVRKYFREAVHDCLLPARTQMDINLVDPTNGFLQKGV